MTAPQDDPQTPQPPQSSVPSKETELSKAMHNPLAQATKKTDLGKTIASQQSSLSKRFDPNQISIQLDKFENRLIKKRRFKE
jgi:hypothetical protein